jgi:hypothetical protein
VRKIIEKSIDRTRETIIETPAIKKQSPIRFTATAFRAAERASALESQKPIRRYEQSPTPSQPRKKRIRLSAVIRTSIKKVKRDR